MLHHARFFRLLVLFFLAPAVLAAQENSSYGFVRTLEGSAAIFRSDSGERIEIGPNQPILSGDELIVDRESWVELVLPDFTIVRIGPESILRLDALAFSGDGNERQTVLTLLRGDLQLVSGDYALGEERPAIELGAATVRALEPGTYRISRTDPGESRLVVRSGSAEMSTDRQSEVALLDEEIIATGGEWPELSRYAASDYDDLELWGTELSRASTASEEELDPALAYSGAAMATGGTWIRVETGRVWRPHATLSWRPFTNGIWVETPSGLTWVSHEPWGWVTAHYGLWSHHHAYGWVWQPGHVYSPAWVFWHWGPEWVGWVPVGYYGPRHHGYPRRSYYGYAGGGWDHYRHWSFCPTRYVGRPDSRRHYRRGSAMPGETGLTAIARGVITSDTSGLSRANWTDGAEVERILSRRGSVTPPSRPNETLAVRRKVGAEIPRNAIRSAEGRDAGRERARSGVSALDRVETSYRGRSTPKDSWRTAGRSDEAYPLPDAHRFRSDRTQVNRLPSSDERAIGSNERPRVPPARRVIDSVRRRSTAGSPTTNPRDQRAVREKSKESSRSAKAGSRQDSERSAVRSRSSRQSSRSDAGKSSTSRSSERKSSSASRSRTRRSKSDG